jgi:hypothetical protein
MMKQVNKYTWVRDNVSDDAVWDWLLVDQESREYYKRKRRDARRIIAQCKREANSRWSGQLTNEFIESKKIFKRLCTEEGRPK